MRWGEAGHGIRQRFGTIVQAKLDRPAPLLPGAPAAPPPPYQPEVTISGQRVSQPSEGTEGNTTQGLRDRQ